MERRQTISGTIPALCAAAMLLALTAGGCPVVEPGGGEATGGRSNSGNGRSSDSRSGNSTPDSDRSSPGQNDTGSASGGDRTPSDPTTPTGNTPTDDRPPAGGDGGGSGADGGAGDQKSEPPPGGGAPPDAGRGDPAPDGGQGPPATDGQNDPPPGGGGGNGQPDLGDELAFIEALATGGRRAMTLGNEHVPTVINVVFFASRANQALTTTGSVTVDAGGNAVYDASPADRLILDAQGRRTEYRVSAFDGDFSGEREFENSHAALKFNVSVDGDCDLGFDSAAGNGRFERRIAGVVTLPRGQASVAVVHGDGSQFDPDAPQLFSGTSITGTVQAAGGTIEVRELFDTKIVNTVFQSKLAIRSTGSRGGVTFECRDVFFALVERDGFPTELDFWRDDGSLLRDGVSIGDFDYDRDVLPNFASPHRVLRLRDGTEIGV